ncbi:hypothetical protein SAMN02799624_01843 [Paenibacillus sp. UNC496MF]|uniref:hypothetical protein n=1 Tax=Paenibacillus sp. UNC496MF TaxID=1502753 RepID=UPI0008DEAF02|nr:hypothetical protein [Paenibacillus sp. UNC496MF]SFI71342.1 hypothetical protein SAMN02799624_01843 [Paenibacillus sp. UNC496MF]
MRRKPIYIAVPIAAVAALALGCLYYNAERDAGMRDKIGFALAAAMNAAQRDPEMPRVKRIGDAKSATRYVAKVQDRPDLIERRLVEAANGNPELPPVKLTSMGIFSDYASARVTVHAVYAGAFGMKRSRAFDYTLRLAAYKHATGEEAYPRSGG